MLTKLASTPETNQEGQVKGMGWDTDCFTSGFMVKWLYKLVVKFKRYSSYFWERFFVLKKDNIKLLGLITKGHTGVCFRLSKSLKKIDVVVYHSCARYPLFTVIINHEDRFITIVNISRLAHTTVQISMLT